MARSLDLMSAPFTRATTGSVFWAQAAVARPTEASAVTRRSTRRHGAVRVAAKRTRGKIDIIMAVLVVSPGHFAQSAALGNERLASTPNERVNAFHLLPVPCN